jgi:hypothetical protein
MSIEAVNNEIVVKVCRLFDEADRIWSSQTFRAETRAAALSRGSNAAATAHPPLVPEENCKAARRKVG